MNRGFSLFEALVALTLSLLLFHLALRVLGAERRMFEVVAEQGTFLETVRVARSVVGREVRGGDGASVTGPVRGDSMALRAYRGWGVICPDPARPGEVLVGRRGLRAPNPDKDSLLVPTVGGGVVVRLLRVGASTEGCGEGGTPERWAFEPAFPVDAGVARYFERGSLHVADGALRYRRGGAGRQPLTPSVLHEASSRMAGGASGTLQLRLGMRQSGDTALALVWEWSTWPGAGR